MRTLREAFELVRKSDLATAPIDLVSERIDGAYLDSVRSCPQYHHGNRLLLDRPPDAREVEIWRTRHRELFAWRGRELPVVITWFDQLDVPAPEFADEVLTAMLAPVACVEVAVPEGLRCVDASDEQTWNQVAELACTIHPEFGEFNRVRSAMLRALVERNRGMQRVLLDERGKAVAAAAGLIGDGVGRYANVVTAPDHRGRGCARFLITSILSDLRRRVDNVVIVAESGGRAEALYRSLGFVPLLSIRSLER